MATTATHKNLIGILSALSPMSALNGDHLQELCEKVHLSTLPAGRQLFNQGDNDRNHVYVVSGAVEVQARGGSAKIIEAGSNEALHPLAHTQPRSASARTVTEASILRVESNLLDIVLTWNQSGSYQVEEIGGDNEAGDDDWMTRILQAKAFHRIPPANIQLMFMRMQSTPVKIGEVVIRQGDEGDYFYAVKQGRCLVTRTADGSKQGVKLAELGPGDSFGEEALISDDRRNATVTMLSDGVLMRLSKADFIALLNEPMLNWMDYAQARALIDQGAGWIDVRLPAEHRQNHIPGSINIPLIFLRMKMASLDTDRQYVVYCDTGRRSSAASFLLSERGFDVSVLIGGLSGVPPDDLSNPSGT